MCCPRAPSSDLLFCPYRPKGMIKDKIQNYLVLIDRSEIPILRTRSEKPFVLIDRETCRINCPKVSLFPHLEDRHAFNSFVITHYLKPLFLCFSSTFEGFLKYLQLQHARICDSKLYFIKFLINHELISIYIGGLNLFYKTGVIDYES